MPGVVSKLKLSFTYALIDISLFVCNKTPIL